MVSSREINHVNDFNAMRREGQPWQLRKCPPNMLRMVIEKTDNGLGFRLGRVRKIGRETKREYREQYGFSIWLFLITTIIRLVFEWYINKKKSK